MEDSYFASMMPYRFETNYPHKALVKTSKSKLDIQIDLANQEAKRTPGISFYCRKRDEYLFIPNTK